MQLSEQRPSLLRESLPRGFCTARHHIPELIQQGVLQVGERKDVSAPERYTSVFQLLEVFP